MKRVVIIGSGNLAEALARAVAKSGLELVQIFARNAERARIIAELTATDWATHPGMLAQDADIYLIAVSDKAVEHVAATLPIPEGAAVAHTAGSVPLAAIPEKFAHRAVFYPMQTFTKGREVDFSVIPVFLETPSAELRPELEAFARQLSGTVIWATSEQRARVHLAAVFACNFANHMYAVGERIVRDALERVGKMACPPMLPILPSPSEWGYRNKMEFAFGVSGDGGKALGLRERGSRNIVEVTGCLLQTPLTMRVLEAVRLLSNGAFHDLDGRFLVVREPNAGGCFVELIVGAGGSLEAGERFAAALRAETPEVTGFALSERLAPSDVAYGERALYADGCRWGTTPFFR